MSEKDERGQFHVTQEPAVVHRTRWRRFLTKRGAYLNLARTEQRRLLDLEEFTEVEIDSFDDDVAKLADRYQREDEVLRVQPPPCPHCTEIPA